MKIEKQELKHFLVLTLSEEIDIEKDAEDLELEMQAAIDAGHKFIALRFTHVSYIYSGIIKIIIKFFKQIRALDGTLCIVETNKALYDVLDIIGVIRAIKIYHTIEDFEKDII